MTDDKSKKIIVVPDDYRPRTPMDYMAVYLEHQQGVNLLPDEQAGKLFKQLFVFAHAYTESYDDALTVDTSGMDNLTAYIANNIAGGIRRAEQQRRRNSYGRSEHNNGGRPKKT